jgi:hypothetical protein
METAAVLQKSLYLPENLDIGEFTLVVERLEEPKATAIAASFREAAIVEFTKLQPVIAFLYDVEIEEGTPWPGSRKSRNKVKLKLKKLPRDGVCTPSLTFCRRWRF